MIEIKTTEQVLGDEDFQPTSNPNVYEHKDGRIAILLAPNLMLIITPQP